MLRNNTNASNLVTLVWKKLERHKKKNYSTICKTAKFDGFYMIPWDHRFYDAQDLQYTFGYDVNQHFESHWTENYYYIIETC